jgi:hypothetical protein
LHFRTVEILQQILTTGGPSHIIKHTHTSFEEAYGYISRLKPAPDVMALYRGFTSNP